MLVGSGSGRDRPVVDRTFRNPWLRVTFRENLGKSNAPVRLSKVWRRTVEVIVDVEVGHYVGHVLSNSGRRSSYYIQGGRGYVIALTVRYPETRRL